MIVKPIRREQLPGHTGCDLGFRVGAGDGNRTRMTSLEGWGSTIELRPRGQGGDASAATSSHRVSYRPFPQEGPEARTRVASRLRDSALMHIAETGRENSRARPGRSNDSGRVPESGGSA
jgi:hypothetical protein